MIRRLRRRHVWMWVTVLAASALGFALALAVRDTVPLSVLPASVAPADASHAPPEWSAIASVAGEDVTFEFRTAPDGSTGFVDVVPNGPLRLPDLLIYWSATGEFDERAMLLGSLTSLDRSRFVVPDGAARPISLVVYDNAHGTVVARVEVTP